MKPLNLRKLTRGQIVKLDGQQMEYLTCDTHSATFRRVSDGRRIEFDLTTDNNVMGWNGVTFQGADGRYTAKRNVAHAPEMLEPVVFGWQ